MSKSGKGRLELWAGPECTINRVQDCYLDQLSRTGHDRRFDDLDRLADLGVVSVRYPILWERHASDPIDWTWADARLDRLRSLNINPIIGLLHHGSGPLHTSLVDPHFPEAFAAYARKVAERFPWVTAFTPINEPLTTARFSGLYGHWFPHGRDDRTFTRCLLTQCRAIVLAMRAIRQVNSHAKLVQTEDFGHTHCSTGLDYQADFENERRWITWDLLCGRVDSSHPLWGYFRWVGVPEVDVAWFLEDPCPPDVIGVNYYVTSERYLDDQTDLYPSMQDQGNGRHRYVDTEAVRILPQGLKGPYQLLREIWQRFHKPIAITEAHIGCTPDEQVRWFWELWKAADRLQEKGAIVRAVTVWSVFGAYDWDALVTRETGSYESGVFDARFNPPRPGALADLLRDLAAGRVPTDPALDIPGWWHRPERLLFAHTPANCSVGLMGTSEEMPGQHHGEKLQGAF